MESAETRPRTPLHLVDRVLEGALILFVGAMTVVVAWEIFARQFLGTSAAWASETARFLQVFTALLGGSYCVKVGAHLGIDAFVAALPRAWRRWTDAFTTLVILVFSLMVLVWGGWILREKAGDQAASALPVTMNSLYLVFPLSGLLNAAYCLERLRLLFGPRRGEKEEGHG